MAKFQAPKLGKQKEKDNAEYILMINEYLDNWIERIQVPDIVYELKTKIFSDGIKISIKFGREKSISIIVPNSVDKETLQKVEKLKEITINKFMNGFLEPLQPRNNTSNCNNDADAEQSTEDDSEVSITQF